jgi:hypothetical protein
MVWEDPWRLLRLEDNEPPLQEDDMGSDDQRVEKDEEGADVEAHRSVPARSVPAANEEPTADDDAPDVEAHRAVPPRVVPSRTVPS